MVAICFRVFCGVSCCLMLHELKLGVAKNRGGNYGKNAHVWKRTFYCLRGLKEGQEVLPAFWVPKCVLRNPAKCQFYTVCSGTLIATVFLARTMLEQYCFRLFLSKACQFAKRGAEQTKRRPTKGGWTSKSGERKQRRQNHPFSFFVSLSSICFVSVFVVSAVAVT